MSSSVFRYLMPAASPQRKQINVLFICLANICRSPLAEVVFRQYVKEARLSDRINVYSAGISKSYVGHAPDPRACRLASQRGYDLTGIRARKVRANDFADADYVLPMDVQNLRALLRLCPPQFAHKVTLFTDFCSIGVCTIPDPYAGGMEDFMRVLDLVEDAAQGLLRHIRGQL